MAPSTLVLGPWLITEQQNEVIIERAGGVRFVFSGQTGALREWCRHPPDALRTLASFDPRAAEFVAALRDFSPTSDRAALLRGTGWARLFVELTNQCNERCAHCYASSTPESRTALAWPAIQSIVGSGILLGFRAIQFTGGDPLISEHCAAAVREARERGFADIEISTNGLALTGALWEDLRGERPGFAFSLYSHDSARHDAITCTPGSQTRTLRAIERTLSAGLRTRVSIVLAGPNDSDEAPTRLMLATMGVAEHAINCDTTRAVGRGVQLRSRKPYGAGTAIPAGHRNAAAFDGTAAISSDGTVHPCVFARHRSLGNVHERSLADILTDESPVRWSAGAGALASALSRSSLRLACADCQFRDVLLYAATGSP